MSDESYSFSTARARLEDIVAQVRRKDTSLEKSLDLLEEGVRLANACTELIDQQDWTSVSGAPQGAETSSDATGEDAIDDGGETVVVDGVAVVEDVVIEDEDGEFVAEIVEVTEYVPLTEADAEQSGETDDFQAADDAWADESEEADADESDEPSVDEG